MAMVVIGEEVQRTEPVAVLASATSGERVFYWDMENANDRTIDIAGSGVHGSAALAPVPRVIPPEADIIIAAAMPSEIDAILSSLGRAIEGKPILLAPGGFGGTLAFSEKLKQMGHVAPSLAEVPGWLCAGKMEGGTFQFRSRKRHLPFASVSDSLTRDLFARFSRYVPDLVASDLVTTSLSNINNIAHPPLMVLNATRVENGEKWHYWDEGFTPAVERLILAVDEERTNVIHRLGGDSKSLLSLTLDNYGPDGMVGESFYDAVKSFPGYRGRVGPTTLSHRFLTEDVPSGIAAYEELAKHVDAPHAALTALRVLSEIVLGRELQADTQAVASLAAYGIARAERR